MQTLIGPLFGEVSPHGLCYLGREQLPAAKCALVPIAGAELSVQETYQQTCHWLEKYFAQDFTALPVVTLDLSNGRVFEQLVWEKILQIPCGTVCSYGDLALAIGRPGAARAVGGAVGRNPVMLINPCHRVIGTSGRLTGYAGGLGLKQRLLVHEGYTVANSIVIKSFSGRSMDKSRLT